MKRIWGSDLYSEGNRISGRPTEKGRFRLIWTPEGYGLVPVKEEANA